MYEDEKPVEPEVSKEDTSVPVQVIAVEADSSASEPVIDTSHWRSNLLHEHESGYVEPSGYLYFTGENDLLYSRKDLWLDGGDDCRLALTIPLDLAQGYLVMAYANEKQ